MPTAKPLKNNHIFGCEDERIGEIHQFFSLMRSVEPGLVCQAGASEKEALREVVDFLIEETARGVE